MNVAICSEYRINSVTTGRNIRLPFNIIATITRQIDPGDSLDHEAVEIRILVEDLIMRITGFDGLNDCSMFSFRDQSYTINGMGSRISPEGTYIRYRLRKVDPTNTVCRSYPVQRYLGERLD